MNKIKNTLQTHTQIFSLSSERTDVCFNITVAAFTQLVEWWNVGGSHRVDKLWKDALPVSKLICIVKRLLNSLW